MMSGVGYFYRNLLSVSSNTSNEQSAGNSNEFFKRSANAKAGATTTTTSATMRERFLNGDFTACPKTLPYAAPRREPETIQLEEGEEGEDAGEICEDGLPKPIQVGNCLFQCKVPTVNAEYSFPDDAAGKRMLKRYLFNCDHNDVYSDADNAGNTLLHAANK